MFNRNQQRFGAAVTGLALAATLAGCGDSSASDGDVGADYYKGKTITWVVASGPGGGSDVLAKTIAPYLTKYLEGKPKIEFVYKDGGAGVEAANYIAKVAKPDGLTITTASQDGLIAEVLGSEGVEYSYADLDFLGNFISDDQMMVVREGFGVTDLDDFVASGKKAKIGARSASHPVARLPLVLQAALGKTLFDPTYGYEDSDAITLDMERGAVDGRSISVGTLESTHPEWIEDGFVVPLVYGEEERHPDFPDVPSIAEITPPDKQELLQLIWAPEKISRSYATAPKTPDAILDLLVDAFGKMAADEELKTKITDELGFPFAFVSGADLDKAADEVLDNEELRTDMKELLSGE